jgi:uncharacterized RDD family membrane protein YckC
MKPITVLNQANVPTGPFTREQVAEKLQSGEFSLDALAFVEGLTRWTPLRDVLAQVEAPVPPVPPAVPPFAASPPASPAAYSYAATMEPPPGLVYAGFWLRFVAYLVDSFILGLPIGIIFVIMGTFLGGFAALTGAFDHHSGDDGSGNAANTILPFGIILMELVAVVSFLVLGWLYYALLESGPHQSTWGKRVMGLKVTDMTGARLKFGHASGRFFGKIITGIIPFAIGYIMAGFTSRKQALHDLIAGTLVIKS